MVDELKMFLPIAKEITKKNYLPILKTVLIKEGKVIATDIENTVVMLTDCKKEGILNIDFLDKVLKSNPSTFDFNMLKEEVELLYSNKKFKYFNKITTDDFPSNLEGEGSFDFVTDFNKEIINNLYGVLKYASVDETRPQMMGVLFDYNKDLTVVATSGHILKRIKSKLNFDNTSNVRQVIPRKAIELIKKYGGDEVAFYMQNKNDKVTLLFVFENGISLYVRGEDGVFPDYECVIPKDLPFKVEVNRKEMQSLMVEILEMVKEGTYAFSFESNKLKIHASAVSKEECAYSFDSEIDAKFEENDMKIGLNPKYVLTFMNDMKSERIQINIKSPTNAITFSEVNSIFDNKNKEINLMMPIRLEE